MQMHTTEASTRQRIQNNDNSKEKSKPDSLPFKPELQDTSTSNGTGYAFNLIPCCEWVTSFFYFTMERLKPEPEKIDFSKLTETYRADLMIHWIERQNSTLDLFLPEIKKLSDPLKFKVAKAIISSVHKNDPGKQEEVISTILPSLELSRKYFLALFDLRGIKVLPQNYLKTLNLTPDEKFSLLISRAISYPELVHLEVGFFELDGLKRLEIFLKSASIDPDKKTLPVNVVEKAIEYVGYLKYYNLKKKDYLEVINTFSSALDTYNRSGYHAYSQQIIAKTLMTYPHPELYRFELAKIFASHNPSLLASYFDLSSLSQDQRVEVFTEALKKNANEAFLKFDSFKIEDEKKPAVINEALNIAPLTLLSHQKTFPLDDKQRYSALLSAASDNPKKTSKAFISSWLANERERLTIAEAIANRDGKAIGETIEKFNLSEPLAFEIAQKAVEQNAYATLYLLSSYGLSQDHFNTIHERATEILTQ